MKTIETKRQPDEVPVSNREWQAAFDAVTDALCVLDRDQRIRWCNKAMLGFIGAQSADLLGRSSVEFIPGSAAAAGGSPFERMQASLHRESLEFRRGESHYLVTVDPVLDERGALCGAVHILSDITARKTAEREREQLILGLQAALNHVRTLSGLLPICSRCKKIRDDQGYWQRLECYFMEHSHVTFTHSLCPECARDLYPEVFNQQVETRQ